MKYLVRWMALASLLPCVAMGATGGYHLTAANTHISFEVRRLGLRLFSAEFHQLSGDFVLDGSPEGGAMGVVVQMGSIDCHDAGWNVRLRSPQWLDVQQNRIRNSALQSPCLPRHALIHLLCPQADSSALLASRPSLQRW